MSEVSREYYGSYSVDDEDQLQFSDTLDGRGVSDLLDEGYSRPEKWSAGEGFGTTAAEALQGGTSNSGSRRRSPTSTRMPHRRSMSTAQRSFGTEPVVSWLRTRGHTSISRKSSSRPTSGSTEALRAPRKPRSTMSRWSSMRSTEYSGIHDNVDQSPAVEGSARGRTTR